MGSLFQELTRRNVFRVGAAYLVLAWLVLQIGSVLAPILGLPSNVLSFVVFALVLGFPLAVLFAWAYELTPDGLKRSADVDRTTSVAGKTGKTLNWLTTVFLVAVVALLLADRFFLSADDGADRAGTDMAFGERSYDSIAVLPFVNMSEDASQEFFSDGISEELLNLLAKTKGLRVAARTSSFAFKGKNQDIKGIGEQLDVETVLEGSVRKADTRLRITAQLIDVESGYHLWSETYDRELTDVFAVQDEISEAIVLALAVHFEGTAAVAPKSSAGNVEAFEQYLLGRTRIGKRTRADIEAADDHFRKAIEIDPDYAPPWAGRADAIMLLSDTNGAYGVIPEDYAYELARPMIEKALELDADLPDAHNSLGFLLDKEGHDEEALKSFDRALELRPSFPIALMWKSALLNDLNRWSEANKALETAHRLDPLSFVIIINMVSHERDSFNLAGIEDLLRKARQVAPDRPGRIKYIEGIRYRLQGDLSSAYTAFQMAEQLGEGGGKFPLALTCWALGDRECALDSFQFFQTWIHLGYGDSERARASMAKSSERFRETIFFKWQGVRLAALEGNLAEAERLVDEIAGDDPLSEFGPLFDEPANPVALIYLSIKAAVGDGTAVERVVAVLDRFALRLEEEGYGNVSYPSRVVAEIYRGDHDAAMEILREAGDAGLLSWYDRNDPLVAPLNGRDDFQALFDKVDAHVNKERAELGWEPMSLTP